MLAKHYWTKRAVGSTNEGLMDGGAWTDLPFELHWPGYQFLGPGTKLERRLGPGDRAITAPINGLDEIARKHDICYRDNPNARGSCDKQMLDALSGYSAPSLGEKIVKGIAKGVIGTKYQLGLGSAVQSVWVPKSGFSEEEARAWIELNGYSESYKPMDNSGKYWKFRQGPPKGKIRTKTLENGVQLKLKISA